MTKPAASGGFRDPGEQSLSEVVSDSLRDDISSNQFGLTEKEQDALSSTARRRLREDLTDPGGAFDQVKLDSIRRGGFWGDMNTAGSFNVAEAAGRRFADLEDSVTRASANARISDRTATRGMAATLGNQQDQREFAHLSAQEQREFAREMAKENRNFAHFSAEEQREFLRESWDNSRRSADEQRAFIRLSAQEQREFSRLSAQEQREFLRESAEDQQEFTRESWDNSRRGDQEQREFIRESAQDQRAFSRLSAQEQREFTSLMAQENREFALLTTEEQREFVRESWDNSRRSADEQRAFTRLSAEEQRAFARLSAQEQREFLRESADEQRDFTRESATGRIGGENTVARDYYNLARDKFDEQDMNNDIDQIMDAIFNLKDTFEQPSITINNNQQQDGGGGGGGNTLTPGLPLPPGIKVPEGWVFDQSLGRIFNSDTNMWRGVNADGTFTTPYPGFESGDGYDPGEFYNPEFDEPDIDIDDLPPGFDVPGQGDGPPVTGADPPVTGAGPPVEKVVGAGAGPGALAAQLASFAGPAGVAAVVIWAGHTILTSASTVTYKGKKYKLDNKQNMRAYTDARIKDQPNTLKLFSDGGQMSEFQRDASQVETSQLEDLFASLNRQLLAIDPHEFGSGNKGQDYVIAMGELQRRGVDPLAIQKEAWSNSSSAPEHHTHLLETMLRSVESRGINKPPGA